MDQLTHLVEIHVLPSYFIVTIFNNLDMTSRSDFHNEQPINSIIIIFKGMSVWVIYFLALFGKYENIIDVAKSISFIDFDQTIMMIYLNSSIDIILIAFELKKLYSFDW